jgi:hypothetical protein
LDAGEDGEVADALESMAYGTGGSKKQLKVGQSGHRVEKRGVDLRTRWRQLDSVLI